uniref:LOB domain-containing protein n=1 Tax=Leersia perrieri TaxID=77586 RepID=A0A0D9V266_9ORYZ
MFDENDDEFSSGDSKSPNTDTPQPESPPPPPPSPPTRRARRASTSSGSARRSARWRRTFRPTSRPRFQNAQRLFSIKNILRIMKKATAVGGEETRDDAVTSVIYESDAREADPVFGAAGITCKLSLELNRLAAELAAVSSQVEFNLGSSAERGGSATAAAGSRSHGPHHPPSGFEF